MVKITIRISIISLLNLKFLFLGYPLNSSFVYYMEHLELNEISHNENKIFKIIFCPGLCSKH